MIPKVMHLYWGRNKPLSYMRFFTVLSFAHYNPDWHIKVWYPTQSSARQSWASKEQKTPTESAVDWFDALHEFASVHQVDVLGLPADVPEVVKSDCLRWQLLSTVGGLWSDFDIVYVKPMTALSLPPDVDGWLCSHLYMSSKRFFTVGFMLGAPGCAFFGTVCDHALMHYRPTGYQSAGREALEHVIGKRGVAPGLSLLPPHCVYPVDGWNDRHLHAGPALGLLADTIGIHWWAGSPRLPACMATVEPGDIHKQSSPLFQHVQRVYNEAIR